MSANTLSIRHISKSYNKRCVVADASFEISCGEIVGLLGPNGAGKTTCFYIASGLLKADSGKVILDEQDITKLPIDKRAILGLGYLPQEASIFRTMTVAQNIMAVLQMRSELTKSDRSELLAKILAEFKIQHIQDSLGVSLSGGERRRVEVARIIAMSPKFVLLDEPFAGVDPIAVADLQQLIFGLKNKNIGVLITDHNFREMLDTCDKSYVLSDGHIIAHGSKTDILNNTQVKEKYLGNTKVL